MAKTSASLESLTPIFLDKTIQNLPPYYYEESRRGHGLPLAALFALNFSTPLGEGVQQRVFLSLAPSTQHTSFPFKPDIIKLEILKFFPRQNPFCNP